MKKQWFLAGLLAFAVIPFAACEKDGGDASDSSPLAETHTYVEHAATTPTCDTDGNDTYYTCEDCDKIFDEHKAEIEEIPTVKALGHDFVLHEEQAGNCHTVGVAGYYTCDDCKKLFDLAKEEIDNVGASFGGAHTSAPKLEVLSQATKLAYLAGETFDPMGMLVVYTCDDCEGSVVNNQYFEYIYQNGAAFQDGDTKITVRYAGLSLDVAVTAKKAVAVISGVEESYETTCGIAPDIAAKCNVREAEILIQYYDGATEVSVEDLAYGKTYTAKVSIADTEFVQGAEVTSQVQVSKHGHSWRSDEEDARKLWYQCDCGEKEDFYAMKNPAFFVDFDDMDIDLSKAFYNVGGEEVSVQSIKQISRQSGQLSDIEYTNNGTSYKFAKKDYEQLAGDKKPVLALAVSYKIGDIECDLVVESTIVDMLIKTAEDLKVLGYQGQPTSANEIVSDSKYYALAGDIDASDSPISASNPAFEDRLGFLGVFEGNGYTIRNLTIVGGQGLFGAVGKDAIIQNVTFENVSVAQGNYALAFAIRMANLSNVSLEFEPNSSSFLVSAEANNCVYDNVTILTETDCQPFAIFNGQTTYTLPETIEIIGFAQRTVTFDTDGGNKIEPVTVSVGQTVSVPNPPTKEPTADSTYVFIGWYYNDEEWDFNTPITEDITLVAKWEEKAKVKAADVIAMINALPNNVTLPTDIHCIPAVLATQTAYSQVEASEQSQVTNYSKLESLLTAIKGYDAVYVPDKYGVKAIPYHGPNAPSKVASTGALATDETQGQIFKATSNAHAGASIQFNNFPVVGGYEKIYFYVRSSTEGYLYLSDGTGNGGYGTNWKNNYNKIVESYGKNQIVKDTWCLMEFDVADGYFSSDWALCVWGNKTGYTLEVGAIIGYQSGGVDDSRMVVSLDFGAKTDSGESNEYGKVYNISREQYYINENNTNTIGTLQTGKLAAALPSGYSYFEFWLYNPTETEYNFHLAGDVSGSWVDSEDSIAMKAGEWTKIRISAEDIAGNKNGQWYVYILGGDGKGAAKAGWKISPIYAVKGE